MLKFMGRHSITKSTCLMKNLLILLCCCLPLFSWAQDQTLFGNASVIGGFGGPLVEFSQINGEVGADVGGGGGLIINDFFLGGYGLGTSFSRIQVDNKQYNIDFGHGGFWLGYTLKPSKLVHLYTSARIGWGGIDLYADGPQDEDEEYSDNVFVMTPEAGVELNVASFFRIAATAGYRVVGNVNSLPGELDSADFSSPVGTLTFRFGGFGNY